MSFQILCNCLSVFQCLIFLDDPQAVSDILEKLVKEDNLLMAYQICFDLYESASQQFLSSVIQNLRTVGTPIASVPGSTNTGTVPGSEKDRYKYLNGTVFFHFESRWNIHSIF